MLVLLAVVVLMVVFLLVDPAHRKPWASAKRPEVLNGLGTLCTKYVHVLKNRAR